MDIRVSSINSVKNVYIQKTIKPQKMIKQEKKDESFSEILKSYMK